MCSALFVIVVTLGFKISTRGMLSVDLVLIGLIAGHILAFMLGMASFAKVGKGAAFALANSLHFSFELLIVAVIGFSLIAFVSAVVTVGDVSEINKAGAGREATDREISSGTYAGGLSSRIIHVFGRLPHVFQQECQFDRHDGGYEPACRDQWHHRFNYH